jgi:hypothetical protein
MNLEQEDKRFHCCKRPVVESEVMAVCSCGDIYCKTCVAIFTPSELQAVIKESVSKGHFVTLRGQL